MALDDAETIQRFISQIKGQREPSTLATFTSPPPTRHDQVANGHGSTTTDNKHIDEYNKSEGARTPPPATVAHQDPYHLASPEAHPRPSPHISGLKPPFNTPKTAASSPRLVDANKHNEDVAEALSDYGNDMDGRPLSESMWASGSTRCKPSMPGGARSTRVLTPVKAVEPNPAINDTFDRMSFKAADPDHKVGENLIGDRVTRSRFSKTSSSFVNRVSVPADQNHEKQVDKPQVKLDVASDEGIESPAHTETVEKFQAKAGKANNEDLPKPAHTDRVEKESNAPPGPKAYILPHLRGTKVSSEKPVKAEMNPPFTEAIFEHNFTPRPAGAESLTGASSEKEDLETKITFDAWPKQEARGRPAAKIRTVIIKPLPRDSTATFVASLVYGGPIEEIHLRPSAAGDPSALIRFMDAQDCMRFYHETSNGVVVRNDAKGSELLLFVELAKDVDVVGGLLQSWIASGVTRCVRAVGVDAHWGMDGLRKIAGRKNRKVEDIVEGQTPGGARSVVFRFCKVEDAVQFKAALSRDEEWEHCNIHYAADPCAAATGVRFKG